MKRVRGGVQLTNEENKVDITYRALLRKGLGKPKAAIAALTAHGKPWDTNRYSHLFVAWLSEGLVQWPDRGRPPELSPFGRAAAAHGMTHLRDCTCKECRP